MYEHDGTPLLRRSAPPARQSCWRVSRARRSRRWWRSNTSSTWSTSSATRTDCRSRRAVPLTGRREFRTQINSMTDLNEYSPLLAEIDRVCRLQDVPDDLGAGRIRSRPVRGESRARAGCAARLRRGAALQARGEERGARAWLRGHLSAQALPRHGRQRTAHSREPARRRGPQHLRGRRIRWTARRCAT